ncbi:hypothetical protein LTR56_008346 [Elasticomyces elasticus]|nr:hypothetical protein LTR56_008346 [Elasticomyces elasticus]KAK3661482.1 hypothetical protein LTR22_007492 [Elasticomyces elasticus]KAK4926160.1 hypothetical protein LTR49_006864 [Elasticomyces elasticus]KAK5756903.1 hypothetical protein LTS12_012982 [Elasticomyces elasticus]
MATVQGALHTFLHLRMVDGLDEATVFQITASSSLLALSLSVLMKRRVHEFFLYSHRAATVVLIIGLWEHVRTMATLSRVLLIGAFGTFLLSTIFQNARQIYKNCAWGTRGVRLAHISQIRTYDDSPIVELKLSRPWKIQPGDYIYLCVLTPKCYSFLQRHPFIITWWEDVHGTDKTQIIYVMLDPQRGWTKSVTKHASLFENKMAWLDGPFGQSNCLEQHGTVVLFASGNGIFAQLPLMKGLVVGSRSAAVKTRRIKLIWQTDKYHAQLQEWIQSVLDDERLDKELLDISIHKPANSLESGAIDHLRTSKIHSMGRRVRIIDDVPDVAEYIQRELKEPRESVAVTVSGHQQLRHEVRRQVLLTKCYNVRFYELEYQRGYVDGHKGGMAA